MHDAPSPPLDRQGIGRLLLWSAPFSDADITLNDATARRLRPDSQTGDAVVKPGLPGEVAADYADRRLPPPKDRP